MKKRIPAIILMFALFLTTSYAANTYRKTITVTSGVNVEFNNEAIDMTDANGKAVEAFIYNGTTYVPIRAVSNAFGADIGYDRNTQTISVYDDFTEIVTAAYKLERTITICRGELELLLAGTRKCYRHCKRKISTIRFWKKNYCRFIMSLFRHIEMQ